MYPYVHNEACVPFGVVRELGIRGVHNPGSTKLVVAGNKNASPWIF